MTEISINCVGLLHCEDQEPQTVPGIVICDSDPICILILPTV
jgi:hypothetical protein